MLSKLIAELPKLSQQELRALKTACDELIVEHEADTQPLLYDALVKVLGPVTPFRMFARTKTYKVWKQHNTCIEGFFNQHFDYASKMQRFAIMTFTLVEIVKELQARNVPINMHTMTKNLGRFQQVFEGQFPGYIESGLGHLIVQSLERR